MFCFLRFFTLRDKTFQRLSDSADVGAVMRPVFTMLLLMLVVIVGNSMQARAEVTIDFPNDVKITFMSGNFDVKSYSGQMEGVSLYHQGDLVMTADTFELESKGAPSGGIFEVSRLDMSGAALVMEDVTAESVLMRNVDLFAFQNSGSVSSFDDALVDNSTIVLKGIEYAGDSATLKIDAIETLEFKFKSLPNGTRFAERGGFRVAGFTITPGNVSDDAVPYLQKSSENGIDKLVMDFVSAQKTELVLGELHSEYTIGLVLQDLADFSLTTKLRMQLETFGKLVALGVGQSDSDADAFSLLGEVELEAVKFDYQDFGLIDLAIALSAIEEDITLDQARSNVQGELNERVTDMFPRNGERIVDPVSRLLQSGGGLRVRVDPGSPIPLANMLGFMIIPDLALDQLNVRVAHLPPQ